MNEIINRNNSRTIGAPKDSFDPGALNQSFWVRLNWNRYILVPPQRHPKGLIQSPGIELFFLGLYCGLILPQEK
jgi:hypothetical protein